MNVRAARALSAVGLLLLAAACGRKGNPLPPLRPEAGRITDTRLRRIDDRVELRFTIPAANADGTTPSILDRVEIYAMTIPAGAPAPTPAQVTDPSHLKGRVEIRHEREKPAAPVSGAPPDTRPSPGDPATFIDRTAADSHGADDLVLHYVVVGVSGRAHKGPAAGPFDVPLAVAPAAPRALALTYDEETLTLAWQSAAPGQMFRVYDAGVDGAVIETQPLRTPSADATFTVPVEFERPRCFTVRAVQEAGPTLIEGAALAPVCVTPKDTFPPAAPAGLLAVPGEGSIELSWDAVAAKDLAGYVVLRGDGSGDKLQALTKVMPDVHFTDRGVIRGMTYTYVVRAEDARGNSSGPSNRQQVTARFP